MHSYSGFYVSAYRIWHNAQPTASETTQDCVQLRRDFSEYYYGTLTEAGRFYWNDAQCSGYGTDNNYICKIKGIGILLILKMAVFLNKGTDM